jgi:hypothetical protein
MAALLQKVINIKFPGLADRSEADSLAEDFELGVGCKNCEKDIENEDAYFCDNCSNFSICQGCYDRRKSFHTASHAFSRKSPRNYLVRLKQKLPTMKKISEEF